MKGPSRSGAVRSLENPEGKRRQPYRAPAHRPKGRLQVECWCMAEILEVPAEMISAGQTGSCGAKECKPS